MNGGYIERVIGIINQLLTGGHHLVLMNHSWSCIHCKSNMPLLMAPEGLRCEQSRIHISPGWRSTAHGGEPVQHKQQKSRYIEYIRCISDTSWAWKFNGLSPFSKTLPIEIAVLDVNPACKQTKTSTLLDIVIDIHIPWIPQWYLNYAYF